MKQLKEHRVHETGSLLAPFQGPIKSGAIKVSPALVLAALTIVAILIAGIGHSASSSVVVPPAKNAIVLAELFTSEGCSSCPPADDVLSKLLQRQPIKGVTVVGMSENVDYWNSLGWVDPFSSPEFSSRQSEYAERVFHGPGVYTPQMVIDGSIQEVGSDSTAVYHKIAEAAQAPKAAVQVVTDKSSPTGDLQIGIDVVVPTDVVIQEPCDVVVAITEDNMASHVHRGENGGRYLTYTGLVRKLRTAGTLTVSDRKWSGTTKLAVPSEWKRPDLKVVVFLQEQKSLRVRGVAWSKLVN